MHARIALPAFEALGPEGREVYDQILSSRGNIDGPFLAWLHSPKLASEAQALGAFCRFGTSLTPPESEMLILIVATHFRCGAEWDIHAPIARGAGLTDTMIAAIAAGSISEDLEMRADRLARCAWSLLRDNAIPEEIFAPARDALGIPALVEAVGVIGYYSLVAMTLNAFAMAPDARTDTI